MSEAQESGPKAGTEQAERCPREVYEALCEAVGPEQVSVDEGYRWEVAADATRLWRIFWRIFPNQERRPALPWAVVRPRTTDDVAAAVSAAARLRVPVVPYGGGSGLMGGALSLRPGVVIDLRPLDRILEISREDRTARVEAGVVLKALDDALAEEGLMLGHDPWSLPVATVGGSISTNGLGYLAGRYGSMGDQVLALTVVLPDGSVLRTRPLPAQAVGIDLKHLFIGAEGTLGIITEAVLRVFPRPERRAVCAFAFPSFEDGFRAVQEMLAIGMRPAIADYGEDFVPPGAAEAGAGEPRQSGPPTLYLVLDGFCEEVEAQERRAREIVARHGGRDLGKEEAEEFWRHRHDSGERFLKSRAASRRPAGGELPPHVVYEYLNVVVPASRVLEYRRRCQELLAQEGVHLLETGFWGSPELFALVMVKVGRDGQEAGQAMRRVTDQVLALAQDMGGAMEQCHGVGLRWAHLMERQHGPGLALMRRLKRVLDPHNIMNPGKLALDEGPSPEP